MTGPRTAQPKHKAVHTVTQEQLPFLEAALEEAGPDGGMGRWGKEEAVLTYNDSGGGRHRESALAACRTYPAIGSPQS